MSREESCWECKARRWVCSRERPSCRKCISHGRECPGYGGSRPLRFRKPASKNDFAGRRTPHRKSRAQTLLVEDNHSNNTRALVPTRPSSLVRGLEPAKEQLHLAEAIEAQNVVREQWYRHSYLDGNLFHYKITSLDKLSPASQHVLVIRVLAHHIVAADASSDPTYVRELRIRAHDYAGKALQAVQAAIEQYQKDEQPARRSAAVTGAFSLGLLDLFVSRDPEWRPHFRAFQALIDDSGGFAQIYQHQPALHMQMIPYILTSLVSNTTCPARDMLHTDRHLNTMRQLPSEEWEYAPFPCPAPLLIQLVHINHIRNRRWVDGDQDSLSAECEAVFLATNAFSAHSWVFHTKVDHQILWQQYAKLFHAAIRLYACSTLQSETSWSEMDELASFILETVRHFPRDTLVQYGLLWPLVVAGAHTSGEIEQDSIRSSLEGISRACGIVSPLVAKTALERYWQSGKKGWEACFDKPYCFLS